MNLIEYSILSIDMVTDSMDENAKRQAIWANVDVPDDCGSCTWLKEIPDASNTGDSPPAYICMAHKHRDCPEVDKVMGEGHD